MKAELLRRFTYHPPKDDQAPRYVELRALAHALAEEIVMSCPASRERERALDGLDHVLMDANAAIARRE